MYTKMETKKTKRFGISLHGDGWNEIEMDITEDEVNFLNRLAEKLKSSQPHDYAPVLYFDEIIQEEEKQ